MAFTDGVKRKMVRETLYSHILQEDRELLVFLPPGYNDLVSYPVLYTQDGTDFFTMGRIATQAQQLILDGEIEPLIIVGVSVKRSERTSEYSPRGARNAMYRSFFVEEMIPEVERRYSIRQDRLARVLTGDSLGGTVSLDLLYDRSDLFYGLLSLSGAFFPEQRTRVTTTSLELPVNLYLLVGLEETAVQTGTGVFDFLEINRKMREVMKEHHLPLTYHERAGGHDWGFWQRNLPDGIKHFFPVNYPTL